MPSKVAIPLAAALAAVSVSTSFADEPRTYTERVQFARGATRTELSGTLESGEARNYRLRARDGQFLSVRLRPHDKATHFNIFLPDGGMLYESIKAGANANEYRGQLFENGDHTVTVYHLGANPAAYEVELIIDAGAAAPLSSAPHSRVSGVPNRAEQACLAAVSRETQNPDVVLLSTDYSEANSIVMVGVGDDRAAWRCLVSNDGNVEEVSLSESEGDL